MCCCIELVPLLYRGKKKKIQATPMKQDGLFSNIPFYMAVPPPLGTDIYRCVCSVLKVSKVLNKMKNKLSFFLRQLSIITVFNH